MSLRWGCEVRCLVQVMFYCCYLFLWHWSCDVVPPQLSVNCAHVRPTSRGIRNIHNFSKLVEDALVLAMIWFVNAFIFTWYLITLTLKIWINFFSNPPQKSLNSSYGGSWCWPWFGINFDFDSPSLIPSYGGVGVPFHESKLELKKTTNYVSIWGPVLHCLKSTENHNWIMWQKP